jgi:thymidine kinase
MCGKLELIIGPMFSGKSTELIRRIRLLQIIDKKILVIKPVIDSRYNIDKITSHNYESIDCKVLEKLEDIIDDEIIKYDTIVVDEGQFFSDLVHIVTKWVDNFNVNVIVGGLDGDFQRQPIGNILNLIPHADQCHKLTSLCNICKDGTTAPFSFRSVDSLDKVLVGGSESYIPVCRRHFNKLKTGN